MIDVNIPFASMVGFVVKWTFAAIPAVLILAFNWFTLTIVFGGRIAGVFH